MKHQLLEIEAELSCAYACLSPGLLNIEAARRHIKAARTSLLALTEVHEQTEHAKPQEN